MNKNVESSMMSLENDLEGRTGDSASDEPASQRAGGVEKAGFEERLSEIVQKEVDRRFQSAKDKRWAQLEKQYGDLSELRGLAETLLSSGEESTDPTNEPEVDLDTRIRSLAELPGLRTNEDARAMILRNMAVDGLEGYAQVLEDLLRMTLGGVETGQSSPGVSVATAVIPGGGDVPSDLAQAYQRRMRQLRAGDVNALTALKREFRQKGLDVF